jgi:hypothetical protein
MLNGVYFKLIFEQYDIQLLTTKMYQRTKQYGTNITVSVLNKHKNVRKQWSTPMSMFKDAILSTMLNTFSPPLCIKY